jgi:surface polysaccharide O-acyltransferase-like enzyme
MVGIDAFRLLAFIAVVLLHTVGGKTTPQPDPGKYIDLLCRFAVPFFFILSGYFLSRRNSNLLITLKNVVMRLAPIFLFWSVFYILLTNLHAAPHFDLRFFKDWIIHGGPGFHLWFLSSLAMNLLLLVLLREWMSPAQLLLAGLCLYAIGVTYAELGPILPNVHWNFRDGPFFGFVFVAIGYWFAMHRIELSLRLSLGLIGLGLALEFAEAGLLYALGIRGFADDINFYLGTFPYAVGVWGLAQSIITRNGLLDRIGEIGTYVLGFYCIHLAYVWAANAYLPHQTASENLLIAAVVAVSSIISILILSRISFTRRLLH